MHCPALLFKPKYLYYVFNVNPHISVIMCVAIVSLVIQQK